MDLKYTSFEHGKLIELSQDLVLWQRLVLLVLNLEPVQNLSAPLRTLIYDSLDYFIF
jgi:hypothetical protein